RIDAHPVVSRSRSHWVRTAPERRVIENAGEGCARCDVRSCPGSSVQRIERHRDLTHRRLARHFIDEPQPHRAEELRPFGRQRRPRSGAHGVTPGCSYAIVRRDTGATTVSHWETRFTTRTSYATDTRYGFCTEYHTRARSSTVSGATVILSAWSVP